MLGNLVSASAKNRKLWTQAGGMNLTLDDLPQRDPQVQRGPQVIQSLLPALGFGRDAGNIHKFEATEAWTPDRSLPDLQLCGPDPGEDHGCRSQHCHGP